MRLLGRPLLYSLVDPFVGLRGRLDVTDNLYVFARGDVGGFGVGSDFVWNVNTGVGFDITEHFGVAAGYPVARLRL